MQVYHILGVMSGSSLDALDFAVVRFEVDKDVITNWELKYTHSFPLTSEWKQRLTQLPHADLHTFFETDAAFGVLLGQQCKEVITQSGIMIDAISSHGHTILHQPASGYTIQIGNPASIAVEAGAMVIDRLRDADIAAGGQGAPLAPVAEYYLFPGHDFYLNLGGIANLSSFTKDRKVRAWDICPANQLLNFLAQQEGREYDAEGMLARSGVVHADLLSSLLKVLPLPLSKAYSMDNSWVQQQYFPILQNSTLNTNDKLATVTKWIARSVALQITSIGESQKSSSLFITGGGAHNNYLVERIRSEVLPVEVSIPSESIVDFKEAMLMALCGLLRLLGKPNSFGSVTGARYDTINGRITYSQKNINHQGV